MNIFHDIKIAKDKVIKVIKPNIKSVGPVIFNEVKQLYVFRIDELYLAYKDKKEAERIRQNLLIEIQEFFEKLIEDDTTLYEQLTDNPPASHKRRDRRTSRKNNKPGILPGTKRSADFFEDEKGNAIPTDEDASTETEKPDYKRDSTEYKAYMKGYNRCIADKGDKFNKKNPFQEGTKLNFK